MEGGPVRRVESDGCERAREKRMVKIGQDHAEQAENNTRGDTLWKG